MSELAKALASVQRNLPDVKKDKTANVQMKGGGNYSYKYADLSSVSDAVLPLLATAGLAWVTMPSVNEAGRFVLHYKLMHESGESLDGSYPLPSSDRPQDNGSAITYARRYALCSVVGVVPDEDDDGHVASNRPSPRKGAQPQQQRPAKQADPSTGEVTHNLQSLMLSELAGPQRPAFLKALAEKHKGVNLTAVPDSLKAEVETMINAHAAGGAS